MINFNFIIDKKVVFGDYLIKLPRKNNQTEEERKLIELLYNHLETSFGFKEEDDKREKTQSFFRELEKAKDKEYELEEWAIEGEIKETFLSLLDKIYYSSEMTEAVQKAENNKRILETEWENKKEFVSDYIAKIIGFAEDVTIDAFITSGGTGGWALTGKNKVFVGAGNNQVENVIYLLHEGLHANILPYEDITNRDNIENTHTLIQYLADKELNYRLSGEAFTSKGALPHTRKYMNNMYPFFLGYVYRNETNPEEKIEQAILRDAQSIKTSPTEILKECGIENVDFQSLDSKKIAMFFRDKKDMNPYEFVKIDFLQGKQLFLKTQKEHNPIEDECR